MASLTPRSLSKHTLEEDNKASMPFIDADGTHIYGNSSLDSPVCLLDIPLLCYFRGIYSLVPDYMYQFASSNLPIYQEPASFMPPCLIESYSALTPFTRPPQEESDKMVAAQATHSVLEYNEYLSGTCPLGFYTSTSSYDGTVAHGSNSWGQNFISSPGIVTLDGLNHIDNTIGFIPSTQTNKTCISPAVLLSTPSTFSRPVSSKDCDQDRFHSPQWSLEESTSPGVLDNERQLTKDEKLIIELRGKQNLSWEDVVAKFSKEAERPLRSTALRIKFKRLLESNPSGMRTACQISCTQHSTSLNSASVNNFSWQVVPV